MKNDSRRPRRRRSSTSAQSAEQEQKGPVFDDSAKLSKDSEPEVKDSEQTIREKIEEAKNDGWGKNVKEFFGSKGGILLPLGVIALAVVLSLVAISVIDGNKDIEDITPIMSISDVKDADKDEEVEDREQGEQDQTTTPIEQNETPKGEDDKTVEETIQANETETTPPTETIPAEEETQPQETRAEQETSSSDKTPETAQVQPTFTEDNSSIIMTAQAGDGITHLARRTIQQTLLENDIELSAEQLVYAEDYLQNMTGSQWLEIGQTVEFSQDDIGGAINAAQGLQDWQVQNLTQYTMTI